MNNIPLEIDFLFSFITTVVLIGIGWGTFTNKIKTLNKDTEDLKKETECYKKNLVEIQVRLAEIQKDIIYIKEKFNGKI